MSRSQISPVSSFSLAGVPLTGENWSEKAGLVEVRREGRSSHYRLERERLLRVVGGWLANLRPPTPEQKWLSAGPKSTRALALRQGRKTTKSKSKGKRR